MEDPAQPRWHAVNALSRTSAWAVGGSGPGFVLTEHWDGLRWTTPPKGTLEPGVSFASLNGVAAANPDYAWAVGSADKGLKHITLIEKWDGTRWQQVPSP